MYPSRMETAFKIGAEIGYDGLEIMINKDEETRNPAKILSLSEKYDQPILSVHAPVLLFTSYVYGISPRNKLERTVQLAYQLGASTVVVHPPYSWQKLYSVNFSKIVREFSQHYNITIAVENMFNPAFLGKTFSAFAPSWNPGALDVDAMTLDFSHSAYQGINSLRLAQAWGDKLKHVHLCDGTYRLNNLRMHDEHLVPGKGSQPVAETLKLLKKNKFSGHIVAEVHTENYSPKKRFKKLTKTLEFAKKYS